MLPKNGISMGEYTINAAGKYDIFIKNKELRRRGMPRRTTAMAWRKPLIFMKLSVKPFGRAFGAGGYFLRLPCTFGVLAARGVENSSSMASL